MNTISTLLVHIGLNLIRLYDICNILILIVLLNIHVMPMLIQVVVRQIAYNVFILNLLLFTYSICVLLNTIVLKSVVIQEVSLALILIFRIHIDLISFLILVHYCLLHSRLLVLDVGILSMVYLILRNLREWPSLLTYIILYILKRCRYFLFIKFIIIILLVFNLIFWIRSVYLSRLILDLLVILVDLVLWNISIIVNIIVSIFIIVFLNNAELARSKLSLLRLVHFI